MKKIIIFFNILAVIAFIFYNGVSNYIRVKLGRTPIPGIRIPQVDKEKYSRKMSAILSLEELTYLVAILNWAHFVILDCHVNTFMDNDTFDRLLEKIENMHLSLNAD